MDKTQIQQVRRFNRAVTRRIGALEDSYLSRGRPLGEARVLFEIGGSADVRTIRDRLGLDSGYLSRLLRSLEAQRLIRMCDHKDDARRRDARLTAKGRAEFTAYDTLSDDLARSVLEPLNPRQRERLVSAMSEVETLLRAAAIEIRVEALDSAAARSCLHAYFTEIGERFDTGFDPAASDAEDDVAMLPPAGWFLVAWRDGEPIGCGGLKLGDGKTGEIKRLWVDRTARGLGIARRVLHRLEALAADAGVGTLRLDTNRALKEAQAFYRSEGYREVARFNSNPYAHHWFEKTL
jgi:DNA-binding MarR family transcriptional regulator/GNAT superfamily N-acetyltransferase